jgi:hypothetical protein
MSREDLVDRGRDHEGRIPARSLDRLDPGVAYSLAPKALLVSTFSWATAGRLAVALEEAGFAVDAVGPSASVVHSIGAVRRANPLSLIRPLATVRRAVEASVPDLVVPTDDPSRQALHQLYAAADPETDLAGRCGRVSPGLSDRPRRTRRSTRARR